jgi:hypothetical protein
MGLPNTPEAAKSFSAGQDYGKLMSGLEEISKGIKPKATDPNANMLTPMSGGVDHTMGGGAASQQLLAQMLANRRRNYGMSLTG